MKSKALSIAEERALNRQALREAILQAGESDTLTIPKGLGHFALAELARLEREMEKLPAPEKET